MALTHYSVTVITKQDAPFNVLPNTPIEIRLRSNNNLATIFSDESGIVPIAQTGATTDNNGTFFFFADADEYNAISNNITIPISASIANAIRIKFNNTIGGATATNVQAVIDEIASNAGSVLVGTSSGNNLQIELNALTTGQIGGLIVFTTKALLDAFTPSGSPEEESSYKVTNDPTSTNNGFYHWDGVSAFVKDADLVQNVIDENNTSEGVSGFAVFDFVGDVVEQVLPDEANDDVYLFGIIDALSKVGLGIRPDGTLFAKFREVSMIDGEFKSENDNVENDLFSITDVNDILGFAMGADSTFKMVATDIDGNDTREHFETTEKTKFLITDIDGKIALSVNEDGSITVKLSDESDEVVAARGDRDSLDERLSVLLDDFGGPIHHFWGEWYLRETRQRLRNIALGNPSQLTVAFIGDSWTHIRARYSGVTADELISEFGNNGAGWTGLAWGFGGTSEVGSGTNGSALTSMSVSLSANWTVGYSNTDSPDLGSIFTSTVSSNAIITADGTDGNIDNVKLFYVSDTGTFRYRFDALGWTSVDTSLTTGLQVIEIPTVPVAGWDFEIELVSGDIQICGISAEKINEGIRVHKLGATGSDSSLWASADDTEWSKAITELAPNLVSILLGTNDQFSLTPEEFKANMQTLISRVKTALPLADVLIIMPCENGAGNPNPMIEYALLAYELAITNRCAFYDLQYVFGDDFSEYSSTSARNWFNVDGIHPEPSTGGVAIVDSILRLLKNS